uniref:Solute carrier family 22 5 n=1 Tax=Echinococcus granulosus TaxID=6210 RepID=A0A068WCT3_ECHGR|nr:Solute carrier family 22 5 [Echinococcus granulosus]
MAGLFFGAFTCGALADRFGRLRVLYISLGIMCILSFMTIWITNISSFCVVTFLLGICCQGCGLTSYTIILETVDEKHRALCGILEQIFYAFGIALTALLAYYFLDWRNLAKVFATCGPIAFVCMLPFHIESTRWLLVQPNRRAAALKNLNYIARINGTLGSTKLNGLGDGSRITSLLKSLSHEGLRATENVGLVKDTEPLIDNVDKKVVVKQRSIQREGCCTLCLHPLLRKWMLIFSVSWFSNAAAYYGSTIASGEAFTNRFLSFMWSPQVPLVSSNPRWYILFIGTPNGILARGSGADSGNIRKALYLHVLRLSLCLHLGGLPNVYQQQRCRLLRHCGSPGGHYRPRFPPSTPQLVHVLFRALGLQHTPANSGNWVPSVQT